MSRRNVVRHIQFKTVTLDGKASHTSVNLKLTEKPSGCVIWIVITPQLDLHSFLWLGGPPGQPLPNTSTLAVTKHTKGNAEGVKTERPNHRRVPRSWFMQLGTLDAVIEQLFGSISSAWTEASAD